MPDARRGACLDLEQADDVHEHRSHAARIAPRTGVQSWRDESMAA